MTEPSRPTDFFIAGGTLRPDSPSYVKRPADDVLFKLALAGQFCCVLTARQLGKSSLMVRTARQLQEHGASTAIIDLTKIGTAEITVDQWYLGLITRLKADLKLSISPNTWWAERASLDPVQRFTDFLRDVVLQETEGPVVIFIDEIDSTLNLDFSDDFFAAIRAMYNARANDPELNRLTFVLLGLATPTDLIKDRTRTPFNIGQGIALQEFSYADAQVLEQGVEAAHPGQGETIFACIFHWTNGHPYLTQKLCLAAAERGDGTWTEERIDRLVEELFLSEEARRETNLQFVRDSIQASPQRRKLLSLYRKVYKGRKVADDERSPDQNRLKLLGLVRAEQGLLRVRNEIYRRVFDLDWIKANTPVDWARRIAVISTLLVLLLGGLFGYTYRQGQQTAEARAQAFIDSFRGTTSADMRITSLAGLFELAGYEDGAQQLFYEGLSPDEQRALFEEADPRAVGTQLVTVVKRLYTELENNKQDNQLLEAMAQPLRELDDPMAVNLATEIEQWLTGRRAYAAGEDQQAVDAYSVAISLNDKNPGTYFDRALAYAALGQYEEALTDLSETIRLDNKRASIVDEEIRSNGALYGALAANRTQYPELAAVVPTPTSTATWTPTPISTDTPTPTDTPTVTPSPTATASPTPLPTDTPTPTPTSTPTPDIVLNCEPLRTNDLNPGDIVYLTISAKRQNIDWNEFQIHWFADRGRVYPIDSPAIMYTAPDTPGPDRVTVEVKENAFEVSLWCDYNILTPTPTPTPMPTPTPILRPIIVNFTIQPDKVVRGDHATLSWFVEGEATHIEIRDTRSPDSQFVLRSGSVSVRAEETTSFRLDACNVNRCTRSTVTLTVLEPSPTPIP